MIASIAVDRRILDLLQRDGALPVAEVASRTGLSDDDLLATHPAARADAASSAVASPCSTARRSDST